MCKIYKLSVYRDETNGLTYRHMMRIDEDKSTLVSFVVKKTVKQSQPAKVLPFQKPIKKAA